MIQAPTPASNEATENPPLHEHEMLAQEFEGIHYAKPKKHQVWKDVCDGTLKKLVTLIKKVDECDSDKPLLKEAQEAKSWLVNVVEKVPETPKGQAKEDETFEYLNQFASEIGKIISSLVKAVERNTAADDQGPNPVFQKQLKECLSSAQKTMEPKMAATTGEPNWKAAFSEPWMASSSRFGRR